MDGKIKLMRDKLYKATPDVVGNEVLSIIRKNDAILIRLNHEQLMQGRTSLGKEVQPPYQSVWYAEFKLTKNPLGVVDLNLTGAFYNGWFVSADTFPIFLGSADEKTFSLVKKYGKDIFGEDKDSLEQIRKDIVKPNVQSYFRDLIHV